MSLSIAHADQVGAANAATRGPIACRRCRRLRTKCINDNGDGVPPCKTCRTSGRAAQCEFMRGCSVIDRKDAPRPSKRQKQAASISTASQNTSLPLQPAGGFDPAFFEQLKAFIGTLGPSSPLSAWIPAALQDGELYQQSIAAVSKQLGQGAGYGFGDSASGSGPSTPTLVPPTVSPVDHAHHAPPAHRTGSKRRHPVPHELAVIDSEPSIDELTEAAEIFFYSFYQVGFLHRTTFLRKIRHERQSISPFLISAILSLTAGFVKTLAARHANSIETTCSYYKDRAMAMLAEQCLNPSLECVQALYLLSLSDWGSGNGSRSWMLIGMGLRMVELLRLERKEAYSKINEQSPEHQHLAAESSRRTVWSLLVADDSLTVGFGYQSQARLTVTIHTPCDEDDWDFGSIPTAITPEIVSRSLMGNTISVMSLWSRAARYAACIERGAITISPWDPHGEFAEIDRGWKQFMTGLSPRLKFSDASLAAHQNRKTDMALVHLHLVSQGSQILFRRMYLPHMLADTDSQFELPHDIPVAPAGFWHDCADQAFSSASQVVEICEKYLRGRDANMPKGFTPLMCFVLFLSGAMMSYLRRWPALSTTYAANANSKLVTTTAILTTLRDELPAAARWLRVLQQLSALASRRDSEAPGDHIAEELDNRPLPGIGGDPATSPGQSDPLGMLTGMAVSQPYTGSRKSATVVQIPLPTTTSNGFGQYMPFPDVAFGGEMQINVNGDGISGVGGNGNAVWPTADFFETFGISNGDAADVFGFPQSNFFGM